MASSKQKPGVAQGAGMFNLPKVAYSKETQDLLKGKLFCSKLKQRAEFVGYLQYCYNYSSNDEWIKAH